MGADGEAAASQSSGFKPPAGTGPGLWLASRYRVDGDNDGGVCE